MQKWVARHGLLVVLSIGAWMLLTPLQAVAEAPPSARAIFPDVAFPAPQKAEDRDYLGLSGQGAFKAAQVRADILIVEIFSMYCPYCQKEAPRINELYDLIGRRPDIKDKIKIVGVGAGNSAFEVKVFRDQYKVPFPLLPDEDFKIHKALGEVRTPYFFGLKRQQDGSIKVIHASLGSIDDAHKFLDRLLQEAAAP
jgi:peroxiredoxin